jgi:lysophospholipase L1-like esterase
LSLVTLASLSGCGSRTSVVFIGDSITALWAQANFGQAEWQQHPNWINAGTSGQVSSQLVGRFRQDVVSQHPAAVHILTGTNDVYSTDSPPWQIGGGSAVYDTTDNIKAMVAMAQSAGIKVVLGTIPPWGPGGLAAEVDPSPVHWANIITLNQWIRDYGLENRIPVADYWSVLVSSNQETYIPALTFDSVHPSNQGYAVMTPLAIAAIAQAEVTLQQLQ